MAQPKFEDLVGQPITAIVRVRCGGAFVPRIEALRWNGRAVTVRPLWLLEDRPLYNNEWACEVDDLAGERFPRAWIASGDLVFV